MKLLMENWRRFLNENQAEETASLLNSMGMFAEQKSYGINIAIVDLSTAQPPETPQVIGMIETAKIDEMGAKPCIPPTHEITAVALHPSIIEKGIGAYLYEVAALFVLKDEGMAGGGITSDHQASTTGPAAKVWKKLDKRFGYIKRKTSPGQEETNDDGEITGGNDTFDYDRQTPDPNDDCGKPSGGIAPTDHSLQIPPDRIPVVEKIMTAQIKKLETYLVQSGTDRMNIENEMVSQANRLFAMEYNPEKLGIYQGEPE